MDLLPEAPSWGPWMEEGEVNHTNSQVTSTLYIHFLVKKGDNSVLLVEAAEL